MNTSKIAEDFTVAEQVYAGDIEAIAAAGYRAVICNRPDSEEPGQPAAEEIRRACEALGLDFHHLPFTGADLDPALIEAFREVLDNAAGPVFAYCRSGQRCAYLYMNAMR